MADKEYIERGAFLDKLNKKVKLDYEMGLYNHGALTESFIRFVEIQPAADVVEVVRCKDCKFFEYGDYCSEGKMEHSRCRENDFCSYGERKEQT